MLAGSCTKNDATVNDSRQYLSVCLDNETRTHLGTGEQSKTVLWSEGDEVAFLDNSGKTATVAVDPKYVGTAEAMFAIPAGFKAPYNVVYPASAMDRNMISVAPEQTFTAGMFAEGRAIMYGTTETSELTLKHLCSFIKITTSAPVGKVTIASSDETYCSGMFEVIDTEGVYTLGSVAGHYNTTIAKSDLGQEFVFAIPSQTYAKGFTATVYLANGTGDEKTAYQATGFEAKPGVMYVMPEIAVAGGTDYNSYTIRDAATFVAYLTAVRAGDASAYQNANKETFLGCDIDMTGVNVPANDTSNDKALDGVFSGKDHRIKNWTSTGQALFTSVAYGSTVGDFIIDASCSLAYPASIDGPAAFAVLTNNGVVRNIENQAPIASWSGSLGQAVEGHIGTIVGETMGTSATVVAVTEGCINHSDILLNVSSPLPAQTTYLGGVNGKGSYSKFYNCVNKGKITIAYTAVPAKNHYIGGVTGSANSSGNLVQNCRNYGDITVDCQAGGGAAVAMAGIVGYTPNDVIGCENHGKVLYDTHGYNIKGTMVAGIVAYCNYAVNGCTNYGDVTVNGGPYVGRNTIGSYDGTKTKSTMTSTVGGIIAGLAPGSATSFTGSVTDCANYGNVSWTLSNITGTEGTASAGRHCIAGIAGDSAGPVTGCRNFGDVYAGIHSTDGKPKTPANAGYTIYLGGVAGSCYYSMTQVNLAMDDCENHGNVTMETDVIHTTLSAVGGIVGWPGTESSNTSERKFCKNYGKVSAMGYVPIRIGGVQGNSCPIHDCYNEGEVFLGAGDTESTKTYMIGGIAGFHSGGYAFYNNVNYGKVSTTQSKDILCAGGLVGRFGNAELTLGEGCVVKAEVSAEGCSTGAMIGGFNGTTKNISFTGVTIKDGTKVNGTTLTAENYTNYLHGAYQYTEGVHTISGTFAAE